MFKLILVSILFTGCATAQLAEEKREGMRNRMAQVSRCMDYEECDRPVKR